MRFFSLATLATAAAVLALSNPVTAQTGTPQPTNLGPARANIFTGHVLTPPPAPELKGVATRILYAPSEADDAVLRGAISVAAGGATVDYFDGRAANPGAALLSTYDAVFTWANFAFFDNVGMGDELAAFVDTGGTVIMGSFCTYTSGNFLSGAIMGPAYSPVVSPLGNNHFSSSNYIGDGVSCLYSGVATLTATYRDFLVLQGAGTADGHFADSEIAGAYRQIPLPGTGAVVYANGAGGSQLSPSGDWPTMIANAVLCLPGATSGTCTFRGGVLGTNPAGYDCISVPVAGVNWQAKIDVVPSVGTNTLQTILAVGLGGGINNVPLLGYEMLCLPPYILNSSLGLHSLPVPPGTTGIGIATQGARIEADHAGNFYVVLLNAQDLVIG